MMRSLKRNRICYSSSRECTEFILNSDKEHEENWVCRRHSRSRSQAMTARRNKFSGNLFSLPNSTSSLITTAVISLFVITYRVNEFYVNSFSTFHSSWSSLDISNPRTNLQHLRRSRMKCLKKKLHMSIGSGLSLPLDDEEPRDNALTDQLRRRREELNSENGKPLSEEEYLERMANEFLSKKGHMVEEIQSQRVTSITRSEGIDSVEEDEDDLSQNNAPGKSLRWSSVEGARTNQIEFRKAIAATSMDYFADYPDENRFHICNRIGISATCWGDPNNGYKLTTGNKLTARAQRRGKFIAEDTRSVVFECLKGSVNLIETAPQYGSIDTKKSLHPKIREKMSETSETLVRDALRHAKQSNQFFDRTKVIESCPPSRRWYNKKKLVGTVDESLAALGKRRGPSRSLTREIIDIDEDYEDDDGFGSEEDDDMLLDDFDDEIDFDDDVEGGVDLFLAPVSAMQIRTRAVSNGLADLIETGRARYVGVRGVTSVYKLRKIQRQLRKRNCRLTAAAFDCSLVDRRHLHLIATCQDLGIVPLITKPLGPDLYLAFDDQNSNFSGRNSGKRKSRSAGYYNRLVSLQQDLESIVCQILHRRSSSSDDIESSKDSPKLPTVNSEFGKFADVTATNVALHWIIGKGGVPLPEVNNLVSAQYVLGCIGWKLSKQEIRDIDAIVRNLGI